LLERATDAAQWDYPTVPDGKTLEGYQAAVDLLLSKTKREDEYGSAWPPICSAAFLGDERKLLQLLKIGVDINEKGEANNTALHCASSQGYDNLV